MISLTIIFWSIVSFLLGWHSYKVYNSYNLNIAQNDTTKSNSSNIKGNLTAQTHSQQKGISNKTEVVSAETDLVVTPLPVDTLSRQVKIRRNNGNTMSDATSTGNNDPDEVGCSEDLSQPADNTHKGKKSWKKEHGYNKVKDGLEKLKTCKKGGGKPYGY